MVMFLVRHPMVFTSVQSYVDDLNTRNKMSTAKILREGYRYYKIRKTTTQQQQQLPIGLEGGMLDLVVLIPDHYLFIYFILTLI